MGNGMKKPAETPQVAKTAKKTTDAAIPKRTRAPRAKTAPPVVAAEEMVEQEATVWSEPTTEEIARRAYEIYEARGFTDGDSLSDWLQAERELRLQR